MKKQGNKDLLFVAAAQKEKKRRVHRRLAVLLPAAGLLFFVSGWAGLSFYKNINSGAEIEEYTDTLYHPDTYYDISDVPQEYAPYLWIPPELPADLNFDCVTVLKTQSNTHIAIRFVGKYDLMLTIGCWLYEDAVVLTANLEEADTELEPIMVDGIKIRRIHGSTENKSSFMCIFELEHGRHYVASNLTLKVAEDMARNYLDALREK